MEQGNNILNLLLQLGARPERAQTALRILEASTAGLEKDARAMSAHTAEVLKSTKAQQDAIAVFSRLHTQSQMAVAPIRQMHESLRLLEPQITTTATQTDLHSDAVGRSTLAMRSQSAAAELVSSSLAGLLAGRKAHAAVEAVWETARGVALLAEGTWPPNPAAIMAAGLHFEAAAQYALLAGAGGHHRYSGGAGGSGPRDAGRGAGSSDSGSRMPNYGLAPGAAGAGARFSGSGVVIIRGTQAFENYVASAVNGAVARGVSVTATSAQRGSPVGH